MFIKCLPVLRGNIRYLSTQKYREMIKVQIKQGTLAGVQKLLPNGKPFNSFQGIPYAKPPVGTLRFKSPVALEQFDVQELDCSKERDMSHHRNPFLQKIVGSENCLHLNVYAPHSANEKHLPVMVWIHGGGFWFGSGNSDSFYPLKLMEHDVVVVTINYRLGAMGFLSLPEEGIYGNAGLKDQRLALQWVQENIAKFNGDPNNVTIFGQSAGAISVHMHSYADHANKYFHKAIMQSGTANMEWSFQSNPGYKTRKLAKLLGCESNKTSDILAFLQSDAVTADRILLSSPCVLTEDERRRGLPLPFKPVVEDKKSPDIFIKKPILESLQTINVVKVPTIMGYNSTDGLGMLSNALRKLNAIDNDLERFVPRDIPLPVDSPGVKAIAKEMRNFYFKGGIINEKSLNELANVLSDYHFVVDMQRAAECQARYQSNAPLFFYRFNYVGDHNMYKRVYQFEALKGACHGDELCYMFQTAGDKTTLTPDDEIFANKLCQLWTNFAKYGNPTINGTINWKPVRSPKTEDSEFELDYLSIDKQFEMKKNPEENRMNFWRKIYQNYNRIDYSRLSAKL
ncbi:esterase B1-like isoform X1 [Teleopsis dalmanni]|uniref:esterase B1-like isoform X1 n=2 Tax=Teleopsis dalmanni TaxID=139649 RepID=UPI0018CD59AA|nr:esterase B1-like isoform X1 [Teleopsis dalmanni]